MSGFNLSTFPNKIQKRVTKDQVQEQYIQNIKKYEDFEIGVGIQELMQEVNMKSEQFKFSKLYKDPTIELEYQKKLHPEILYHSKSFIVQYLIITAIYYTFQTYKIASMGGHYPQYKWVTLLVVLFNLAVFTHYKLCTKFKRLSLYFAEIQSLLVMVSVIEFAIMGNPTYASVDLLPTAVVLISSVSHFSYNQSTLFGSYVLCWIYNLTRSYFWIDDMFRYLRWNAFMIAAFSFIYFFSRAFQQRQREKYQKGHQQIQMLKLFHNLIKVYHDGIIITKNDQIIFYNKEVSNIFNIPQDQTTHEEHLKSTVRLEKQLQDYEQIKHKKVLIKDLMMSTFPKNEQGIITTISNVEDLQLNQQSLWGYVVDLFNRSYSFFEQMKVNKQVLEGIYFKYKPESHNILLQTHNINNDKDRFLNGQQNEDGIDQAQNLTFANTQRQKQVKKKSKKLQVFSQLLKVGNNKLIITTLRDMSSWLELEHTRSICNLKTVAFAQAAHEFRNPLNGIIASLDLLEGQIKPSSRKYFEIAKNCSNLMLFLVKDILDFSQLEARSFLLNFSNVNPKDLVLDCIQVLSFKAESKQIGLFINHEAFFPQSILTDENRLKQILINLLSNAIKYTESGHVSINATLDDEKFLQIIVEDTGVGMSEEQIEKLFTQFTKFTKNRHLNQEGVGLGLVISQNLAMALGGSISVTSEVGVGSKFKLEIPTMSSQFVNRAYSNNLKVSDDTIHSDNLIISMREEDDQGLENIHLQKLAFSRIIQANVENQSNEQTQRLMQQFHRSQIAYAPSLIQHDELLLEESQSQSKNSHASYGLEKIQKHSTNYQQCDCPKILIVDDEPFNLMALEGILQTITPMKVEKANNGKQALERIEENYNKICPNHQPIRLVILDQNMPVMNGVQCAQKIREQQRSDMLKKELNLVLFTGDEFIGESSKKWFDMVLKKPIEKREFSNMLKNFQIL